MKKFVVHYLAPAEAMQEMATATEEEKQAGMKPWMDWQAAMGDKLIDMGAPMMGALEVKQDGSSSHKPSNTTGYSIIQAESMEDARALLNNHPHLNWRPDTSIEVYECMEMNMN